MYEEGSFGKKMQDKKKKVKQACGCMKEQGEDIAKELKNSLESKSPIDLRGIDPIPVSIFCFIEHHFMSLLKWGVYNKKLQKRASIE